MTIPDTTPPVTMIKVGEPSYQRAGALYVSDSTGFMFSGNDDTSGVEETRYRVDEGAWITYTSFFVLSTYADGLHTIGYCSSDRAGNAEAEKTFAIVLDKAPPTVSNASPTGSLTFLFAPASVSFTVMVEDAGSGIKEVRLTVDGVSQGTMSKNGDTYSKTVTLSEGEHTWGVEAVDNVDNTVIQSNTFSIASLLIWVLAIIAVVVILLAVLLLRRRRPPPPA